MDKFTNNGNEDGLDLAKRLAEEEEGIGRKPKGASKYLIATIAVLWSFFQLSIASWWTLDSTFIRSIHLGFALLIVYLNYPMLKKARFGLKFLAEKTKIPFLDYIVAIIACFSALYIAVDYSGMITRYGSPITRDIIFGIVLVILLLEAARRVIGPALPFIAIVFCGYSFFGQLRNGLAGELK